MWRLTHRGGGGDTSQAYLSDHTRVAAVIHRRRTEVIMIPLFFQDIETAQRGLLHTGVGSGYEQDPYIRGCLLQYNREAYLFFQNEVSHSHILHTFIYISADSPLVERVGPLQSIHGNLMNPWPFVSCRHTKYCQIRTNFRIKKSMLPVQNFAIDSPYLLLHT